MKLIAKYIIEHYNYSNIIVLKLSNKNKIVKQINIIIYACVNVRKLNYNIK